MTAKSISANGKLPEPMLEHEIRLRAYDLYERRGGRDGHALDDWLQAEYEVWQRRGAVGLAVPSKRVLYR
jgi:hypothetical protein